MKVPEMCSTGPKMACSIHARITAFLRAHSFQLSLLAFAGMPYARMGFQGLILWDDLGFPPFAANLVIKKTFVWHSSLDDTASLHDVPYWAMIAAMQSFGVSQIMQRVWFVSTFWFMGLAMYFLAGTLFPRASRWTYFFAGLLYMYNPMLATYHLVGGTRPWMIAYALSPIALALLAKALRKDRVEKNSVISLSLIVAAIAIVTNVWELEVITYFLVFYNLLKILTARSLKTAKLVLSIKMWSWIIAISTSLSVFWLIPALLELPFIYQNQYRTTGLITNTVMQIRATLGGQTIVDAIRVYSPAWDYGFQTFYSSNLAVTIGLVIPLIASLSLATRGRHRIATAIIGCSLGLFTILGAMIPGTLLTVYAKLIDLLPYGRALIPLDPKRYILYCVTVSLSLLFGLGVTRILARIENTGNVAPLIRKGVSSVAILLMIGIVLFNSWPLLTGYNATVTVPVSMNGRTQAFSITWDEPATVPRSYRQAADYLDDRPGSFNVLVLPSPNNLFYDDYVWLPHRGTIQSLTKTLWLSDLEKPVVFNMPNDPRENLSTLQVIEQAIYGNQTNNIGRLLSMNGIRYVLFRTDIRNPISWTPTEISQVDFQKTWKVLNQQQDLALRATYGNLSLFENLETVSKAYVASTSVAIIGDQSLLVPLSTMLPSFSNYTFVFPEGNSPSIRQTLVDASSVIIVNDPFEESLLNLRLPAGKTVVLPTSSLNQSTLAQFWTSTAYGNGQIGWPSLTDEPAPELGLNESLSINEGAGNFSAWAISHPYKSPRDWSGYGDLFIYWKGNNTGQVFAVDIRTTVNDDSNVFRASFWDNFNGWRRLAFPLSSFKQLSGFPNWKQVTNVILRSENNLGGSWHLGPLFMDSNKTYIENILGNNIGLFNGGLDGTWGWSTTNSVTYQVWCTTNSPESVFIVLSEPYHPYWGAQTNGKTLQHVTVNGVSNGYLGTCSHDSLITIQFQGKNIFDYSASASALAVIALSSTWLVLEMRRRKMVLRQALAKIFSSVKSPF